MKVKVMITNGGTHPPEKWAEQTAEQLVDVIQIEPTYPNYEVALQDKNVLKGKLMEAMVKHHGNVQDRERDQLKASSERLTHDLAPHQSHLEETLADVNAVFQASQFSAHFAKPEVQQFVRSTIASHFASAMHIERSHHADRNPDDQHAKAFRAQHHGV